MTISICKTIQKLKIKLKFLVKKKLKKYKEKKLLCICRKTDQILKKCKNKKTLKSMDF